MSGDRLEVWHIVTHDGYVYPRGGHTKDEAIGQALDMFGWEKFEHQNVIRCVRFVEAEPIERELAEQTERLVASRDAQFRFEGKLTNLERKVRR